jgi:hypothetical protein
LSGTGNNGVAVEPTSLNFGLVQCNSAPPGGQTIELSNKGAAATFSPTFGRGTQNQPLYYNLQASYDGGKTYIAISSGSSNTLPAGSVVTLLVTPNEISDANHLLPATTANNGFSDTLTITTTATGDTSPHVVSLSETAQGALFTFSPSSFTNEDPKFGKTLNVGFTVTNGGNYQADYALSLTIQGGNNDGNWPAISPSSPFPVTSPVSCSNPAGCYPQVPLLCEAYGQSASQSFPNQCENPPGPTCDGNVLYLPEACLNFAGGNIFGGQQQSGVLEVTGYPTTNGAAQATGFISLTPAPGAVLCSDPPPNISYSVLAYTP